MEDGEDADDSRSGPQRRPQRESDAQPEHHSRERNAGFDCRERDLKDAQNAAKRHRKWKSDW